MALLSLPVLLAVVVIDGISVIRVCILFVVELLCILRAITFPFDSMRQVPLVFFCFRHSRYGVCSESAEDDVTATCSRVIAVPSYLDN